MRLQGQKLQLGRSEHVELGAPFMNVNLCGTLATPLLELFMVVSK